MRLARPKASSTSWEFVKDFFYSKVMRNMLGPVPTAGFVAPMSGISCSNRSEHSIFPF